MDAFVAAIEERDHPRLRGLPLVMGAHPRAGKGRDVVSTRIMALIRRFAPVVEQASIDEAYCDLSFAGSFTEEGAEGFADFETKSRSHTLATPANDLRSLQAEALKPLLPFLDRRENQQGKLIRLLGVRLECLG